MAGLTPLKSRGHFTVQLLRGRDQLKAATKGLPDEDSPNAFTTRTWFENLSEHGVSTEHPVTLAAVFDPDGQPAFCLPFRTRAGLSSTVFGTAMEGLSNYYSGLFGPIGRESAISESACVALLAGLQANGVSSDVIDLHPLDSEASFCRNMVSALLQCGYWTDKYFCFGNWYLPTEGRSFQIYEETLPSRLRNTIRRGRRKLDAMGQWTLEIHQAVGAKLDAAIDDFDAIYRQSWKQPEPYQNFIGGLCRSAAEQGWLRLGVLKIEGQPAAAQIWLVRQGRASIFKLAHVEGYKQYSAGSVLTAELMRQALDNESVSEIDYLTGDEPYKADWMTHRRERFGIVAFKRWTVQGTVSALRHFGGRWWRQHARAKMEAGRTHLETSTSLAN